MTRFDIASLDDLRAFETVARRGSIRAAAEEMALTHGAVSRRVSKLSRDLGFRLIVPAGRGIRLTEDGARLARAAAEALALVGEAVREIRGASHVAPTVLSCERSVAMRWLIPRLSRFQDAHPDLPIHLSVGGGALDLDRAGVTFAIRRMDFPADPAWALETLFDEEVGPVMREERVGEYRRGDYLGLGARTRPGAWDAWLAHHPEAPRPREVRLFDHHFLMAEAAANGMGVAMCPRVLAQDDLQKGRLAAPGGFARDGTVYALITLADYPATAAQEAIRNWLRTAAAEFRASLRRPREGGDPPDLARRTPHSRE